MCRLFGEVCSLIKCNLSTMRGYNQQAGNVYLYKEMFYRVDTEDSGECNLNRTDYKTEFILLQNLISSHTHIHKHTHTHTNIIPTHMSHCPPTHKELLKIIHDT